MQLRHNRRGFTLVETIMATGIMVVMVACIVSVEMSLTFCFDRTVNRVWTDKDADLAMQEIVTCVREAKKATPTHGGTALLVQIPRQNEDGTQDRRDIDATHHYRFFLSDESHVPGHSGTWLWKETQGGGQPTFDLLKKDVSSLVFETDTARSIRITVNTRNVSQGRVVETQLTQRVVYMRNN